MNTLQKKVIYHDTLQNEINLKLSTSNNIFYNMNVDELHTFYKTVTITALEKSTTKSNYQKKRRKTYLICPCFNSELNT